jgi:hypothetical protein
MGYRKFGTVSAFAFKKLLFAKKQKNKTVFKI